MGNKSSDQGHEFSEQETAKRADAALRVALSSPPKPLKGVSQKRRKRNLGKVETKPTKAGKKT
jgi:hypothetical protein